MYSLEYTGEEGVQAEAETKPSQSVLAAVLQDAPAKPENLTPENLNPENLNPENLNPENLNKEYAPLNQHSETQEEFTIQYKPGEGVFDQFRYVHPSVQHVVLIYTDLHYNEQHCRAHCTHLNCTLYIVPFTLYNVLCILYTANCTLYTVHCILYAVDCILYIVQCNTVH